MNPTTGVQERGVDDVAEQVEHQTEPYMVSPTGDPAPPRLRRRRPLTAPAFLAGVTLVWAAILAILFGAVFLFAVDRTPTVLARETIHIELSEYQINPTPIEVAPGTEITFVAENTGTAQHNLFISSDTGTDRIKPGESATLLAGVAEGNYVIWCDVKGHRELGMEARVVVTGG